MAAPQKSTAVSVLHRKPKKKRKGLHAKKRSSQQKSSKNYRKLYNGQG